MSTKDEIFDVVIIGAGMAGLTTAYELKTKQPNLKVLILEGSNRIGGRLYTLTLPKDKPTDQDVNIDLGGQWIHGSVGNPFKKLAKQFNLKFSQGGYGGSEIYTAEGKVCKPDGRVIFQDLMEEVDSIVRSRQEDKFKLSLKEGWEEACSRLKLEHNPDCEEHQYINYLLSGTEQYEGADYSDLALGHDDQAEDCGGGDISIKGGYIKLLEKLAEGLNILLEHKVNEVNWKGEEISVKCSWKENSQTFQCRKCVVTLPLGVLKTGAVTFSPPLPKWKSKALSKIGIGLMNKIILKFPTCFWNSDLYNIGYASKKKGEFRWFYNLVPEKGDNILVSFLSANFAKEMEDVSDQEAVDRAMAVLKKIYGNNIPSPTFTHVTHWGQNPFSCGSFAFMKVGCTPRDFTLAGLNVEEKLYFGGEHTSFRYCGCAHGAYDSGLDVASELIQYFSKLKQEQKPSPISFDQFEIRNLREEELEKWFDHLATVFEVTPRNYFVNHWNSDPFRNIEGIQVAIDKTTGQIASSLRVFQRELFIQGKVVPMGGIGEVSTKKEMQGKGLAKTLLKEAIRWMKSKNIPLSTLHTGSAAPLYASLGWNSMPRIFVLKPLQFFQSANESTFTQEFQVRKPLFGNSQEVQSLMKIYGEYALHFNGILNRSHPDYWTKWIPNELNQESFVLVSNSTQKIVAFLSFGPEKRDPSLLMVKDFFVEKSLFEKDRGKAIFGQFVTETLQNHATLDKSALAQVLYPAACFQNGAEGETIEARPGLMYAIIDDAFCSLDQLPKMLNASSNESTTKHLFWDIDKF